MSAHRDLAIAALAAVACAAVALVVPIGPIRVIAVLPLAFVLPGYAVVQASFAPHRLEWPILPMLTLGLSLSILALGAVVLQLLPGQFGDGSWAAWLIVVTLAGCVIAALRRRAPRRGTDAPRRAASPWARLTRPSWLEGAMLAGTAVLVAATAILATTLWPAGDAIGYTRLWMLPSEHGADVKHMTVGVASQEQERTVYRLVLNVGGERSIRRMDLEPGGKRIWRVIVPTGREGRAVPVIARLFTSQDPDKVYRHVTGWIPAR